MERVRPLVLVAVATVVFCLALLVLRWVQTLSTAARVPPVVVVLLAAFGVIVAILGARVRRFVAGRTSMDAVAAARVAALAITAIWFGAGGVGLGAAQLVAVADQLGAPAAQGDALVGLALVVASVGTLVAGLLARHWCRVPPEDPEGRDGDGSARA